MLVILTGAIVEEKNIASSPVLKTKTSKVTSQGSGGYLFSSRELGIFLRASKKESYISIKVNNISGITFHRCFS